MPTAQGKPRKKSYHYDTKTKGVQNDTDNNKNAGGATQKVKGAGKEERFNSQCIDCAGTMEVIGGISKETDYCMLMFKDGIWELER